MIQKLLFSFVFVTLILFSEAWALPTPARQPTRLEEKRRTIALGDFHGDIIAARSALISIGAINHKNEWIGKNLHIVQVGDQLDRGNGEREILDLFEKISHESKKSGGGFYPLLGNHETMNVELDFRYVFDGGWQPFMNLLSVKDQSDPLLLKYPKWKQGRVLAFRPGGPYAKILSTHNVVMMIGKTLFVHGGLTPKYARYGLEQINRDVSDWIAGKRKSIPPVANDSKWGPLWSRHYSLKMRSDECQMLEEVLQIVGAEVMVVAHTVQEKGINSACKGRVWRIDTGMSAYYGGSLEALEIVQGQFRVIRIKRVLSESFLLKSYIEQI